EGDETVHLALSNATNVNMMMGGPFPATLTITDTTPTTWPIKTASSSNEDPTQGLPLAVGPANIDLAKGNFSISQALGGDCGCGGYPVLDFQSDTVAVKPIITATVASSSSDPVPTQITATLTWNGTPQTPVTYNTTGHSAGDTYLVGDQVASAIT